MNHFTIYTREAPPCPFCKNAKQLLDSKNEFYDEVVIGSDITLEEFQESFPDQRSVPLVFNHADKIGGFNELKQYLNEEKISIEGLSL